MRARQLSLLLSLGGWAAVIAACAHETPKLAQQGPSSPDVHALPIGYGPPQYLVADPSTAKGGASAIPLGAPGVHGLVVDRRRVVIGQGEPRVASDATPDPIAGASKVPGRFGGGFLFWTANTLYRADAFDTALLPIGRVPDAIDNVSFASKALVVHTRNGERWGLGLPGGERAAIAPLGVADVEALDDGRALGFNDQGAVFTSTDHGAHWTDATAHVKSSPTKVSSALGDLWLHESNGGASRLETDGRLSWFDKAPPDEVPELRPKDPRWHGAEPPLRAAFHGGAAIDDTTALVLEGGDLVRVDIRTGELLSIVQGHLPPDAHCEAVAASGDILFACHSQAGSSAFVVAHALTDSPVVEQTLAGAATFYASDDGGLAYGGPCNGAAPSTGPSPVCVRLPGGRWEERDLSGLATDAGTADVNVARWVPRADGRAVALIGEPVAGVYDPSSGLFQPIAEEAREVLGHAGPSGASHGRPPRLRGRKSLGGAAVVDSSWSFGAAGSLRGWQRKGESVEISEDGKVTRSPYAFDVVFSGSMGLGRSKDGRLYQSTDHGSTWLEVAAPPSGVESVDLVSCTSAGCDLGAFYRVGWAIRPPRVDAPRTPARPAPEIRRVRGVELACRPQGPPVSKALPRTPETPEDLGLGASRLPVANERNDWGFVRNAIPRGVVSPIHEARAQEDNASPSIRALFSGFATAKDGDVITVSGPNKSAMSLRRGFAYVVPFEPGGRIVRTTIAMSDVVAAGRRAGMTTDEILAEDFTETGTVVTLTPPDAGAGSDVVVHNSDHGLLAVVRGDRVRVAIRTSQSNANVISGVALPGDETALLEVDSSGVGHVFKVGAGTMTDLFDVSPTANETFYPANPDALAIGPKGELAVLRTPSGSEPASALDPAYLLVQAMPPTALAPWSELKLEGDPACKNEPGGWRVTLQLVAPWIRVATPELRVDEAPMLARVRWTPKRVCLEGFEVKLPTTSVRPPAAEGMTPEPITVATWLVARGGTFTRVGITEGVEWRQPLECSVVSTGP